MTTLVLLATLIVLGVTAPARAHVPDREATGALVQMVEVDRELAASAVLAPVEAVVTAAPPPSGVPWMPLLVLAVLLILASRSRRAVVALLIALLAVLAFEAGVHSVHHLGDENEEARCIVASGSSNLSLAVGEPVPLVASAGPGDVAQPLEPIALLRRFLHPDQGRAPPRLA